MAVQQTLAGWRDVQVLGGIAQHGASGGHVGSNTAGMGDNMLMGNMCLLINTMAMAVYYILAKQVVQRYQVVLVAAWAYLTGEWRLSQG